MRKKRVRAPEITSVPEFLHTVMNDSGMMFRGQPDGWLLLPGIARLRKQVKDYENWWAFQETILDEFIKFGAPFVPQADRVEWLIHAQHHGLPTRLLDFSLNPLKALFFAVNDPVYEKKDGVFYALEPAYWREDFATNTDIGKDEITAYLPRLVNARLIAQESCFVCFPVPEDKRPIRALGNGEYRGIQMMAQYSVPAKAKRKLRLELKQLGITYRSLFPDLTGVAKTIVSHLKEV